MKIHIQKPSFRAQRRIPTQIQSGIPRFTRNDNMYGFTLIELSLVLMLIGIILGPIFAYMAVKTKQENLYITTEKQYRIALALSDFAQRTGYLPCPSRTVAGSGPTDSPAIGSPARKCDSESDNSERFGIVPYRVLALAPDDVIDGYGNPFSYAVSLSANKIPKNNPVYHDDEPLEVYPSCNGAKKAGKEKFMTVIHGAEIISSGGNYILSSGYYLRALPMDFDGYCIEGAIDEPASYGTTYCYHYRNPTNIPYASRMHSPSVMRWAQCDYYPWYEEEHSRYSDCSGQPVPACQQMLPHGHSAGQYIPFVCDDKGSFWPVPEYDADGLPIGPFKEPKKVYGNHPKAVGPLTLSSQYGLCIPMIAEHTESGPHATFPPCAPDEVSPHVFTGKSPWDEGIAEHKKYFCCRDDEQSIEIRIPSSYWEPRIDQSAPATETQNDLYGLGDPPDQNNTKQNLRYFAYALISHGRNGDGAQVIGSTITKPMRTAGDLEKENANASTRVFYDWPSNSASNNNHFDDVVLWRTQERVISEMRSNSCMAP